MSRRIPQPPSLPAIVPDSFLSRDALLRAGAKSRDLTDAVRRGLLLRPRNGHYLPPDASAHMIEAVRCGGRVDCVTLLSELTVFVLEDRRLHLQLDPDTSRVPVPATHVVRHWRPSTAAAEATVTPVVEALIQAVKCQPPRAAIATLDSAWHLGLVGEPEIAEIFAALPRAYRRLRWLLDRRAESGTETLVRLMLRGLGYRPELQVWINEVGYVDLLVDGWLIVECDSKKHHGTWDDRKNDLRRDAAAVAQGYTPIRLLAEDILYRPEWVLDVLRRALANRDVQNRAVQNSGEKRARTAQNRVPSPSGEESPEF